jgi:ribonuclease Z
MTNLQAAYAEDIRVRSRPGPAGRALAKANKVIAHDVRPGEVYNQNGVSIRAFMVDHRGHTNLKHTFGYRIDYAGRSVVLSGDTKYCECVIEAAAGADLVIHEVAAVSAQILKRVPFFKRLEINHTSPENVGKVFAAVKPKLGVFTHLVTYGVSPDGIIKRASKTYSGKMVVGSDLMRISVGKLVRVLDK